MDGVSRGSTFKRKCRCSMPGAIAVALAICVTTAALGEVPFRAGPSEVPQLSPARLGDALAELADPLTPRHVVVQFDRPITPAERRRLVGMGLTPVSYLGNHAFVATLSAGAVDVAGLSGLPFITGVQALTAVTKQHPAVLAGDVPDWAVVKVDESGQPTVAVYVLFHPDVALTTDGVDAALRSGATIRDQIESINAMVLELPLIGVTTLAEEDCVQWIEWPLPPLDEVNDSNSVITEADIVQAAPYGLDGSGVIVLIYDGGQARATHVDFEGRLVIGAGDSSGVSDHSTHVACTVGGAGVQNAAYEGMAPGVDLVSYGFEYDGTGTFLYTNPGDIESDYSAAIGTYGADISNNSIGTNTEPNGFDCSFQGDYGITSQLIDTIVRGDGSNPLFTSPFRVVWANGNERQGSRCDVEGYGDYYSTAPPAGAKNHITVGALNSNDDSMTTFSSWGPVDDGRMKPDISAPGCQSTGDGGVTSCSSASDTSYTVKCGTSMAAPTVTVCCRCCCRTSGRSSRVSPTRATPR